MQSMANFLKSIKEKRVILLIHSLPDLDAVGSSSALSSFFKNSKIISPDQPTAKARKLLRITGQSIAVGEKLKSDVLIILDTNSYDLLGELADEVRNFKGSKAVIDHHSIHPDSIKAEHVLIDNSYASTSELVYEILKKLNWDVSEKHAVSLLCGMIDDSAGFRNARKKTFSYISELLGKTRMDYQEILRVTETDVDVSQRIALLTACQRASVERVGDYLIAKSIIGSFEAKAAEALLSLGADFSFVGCKGKREARISARMRGYLHTELGINLASDVMEKVGRILRGSGGGHPCAAGANGPHLKGFEDAMEECVKLTKELLERKMHES
ncbi:MAG: DHH family phosphoesterase [Candidatus Micrarchaeia archaeon]